ncbi:MAG: peptidylprolyl isomerase, partial [Clostridia bacterium]|nr:peptidylprolyl isomerase [Clostridia bacterium]
TIDPVTQQPLSDEEIAKKKVLADDLNKRVLAGEDFDALMKEYSEDPGLETSPDGYFFSSGEMVSEFENTTAALGFNEIGFTESSFGYHIIKRLPVTKDELSEEIEYTLMMDRLSDAMVEWKQLAGFKVTKNESVFQNIM